MRELVDLGRARVALRPTILSAWEAVVDLRRRLACDVVRLLGMLLGTGLLDAATMEVSGEDVVDAVADEGWEESTDSARVDKGSVTFSGDCERVELLIQSV